MSKQSNQKYRKEMELNHKERAKDTTRNESTNTTTDTTRNESTNRTTNEAKNMPSREGYGDGNPDGSNSTRRN